MNTQRLGPTEAAVFETFVVPRYLSFFGEALLDMFISSGAAAVIHLGCRTGYPDQLLADRLTAGSIVGLDPSPSAIDLARAKGVLIPIATEYNVFDGTQVPFEGGVFTHGMCLCPPADIELRHGLIAEFSRLILTAGQVLLAMPMRGSFQEVTDLLREYALKYDAIDFGKAIEVFAAKRPTVEILTAELQANGFAEVDIDLRPVTLEFQNGRDFLEDPVTRLLLLPELSRGLSADDITAPLEYVREAIDKYWSEGQFELTLNVGCASGRRMSDGSF